MKKWDKAVGGAGQNDGAKGGFNYPAPPKLGTGTAAKGGIQFGGDVLAKSPLAVGPPRLPAGTIPLGTNKSFGLLLKRAAERSAREHAEKVRPLTKPAPKAAAFPNLPLCSTAKCSTATTLDGAQNETSAAHPASADEPASAPPNPQKPKVRKIPASAVPAMRRLQGKIAHPALSRRSRTAHGRWGHTFAALDLGTNNCRLLIARPHQTGFRVLDAFSRTVGLGEGLAETKQLSSDAMDRTLSALKVCADKMVRRGVTKVRAVATQACRTATNGADFVERATEETGLDFEIISTKEEARLAVESCSALIDRSCDSVLVFDIGGGSTELIWLDLSRKRRIGAPVPIRAWTSVPFGVVTLADRFGIRGSKSQISMQTYQDMVDAFRGSLQSNFRIPTDSLRAVKQGRAHLVGNSGTVTTIAGVMKGLKRYDRSQVDGSWLNLEKARDVARSLSTKAWSDRAAHPCIGADRADLLSPGSAILEAIHDMWPCSRLRVADRGLREGVLLSMMARADRDSARKKKSRKSQKTGSNGSEPR